MFNNLPLLVGVNKMKKLRKKVFAFADYFYICDERFHESAKTSQFINHHQMRIDIAVLLGSSTK